MIVLALLTVPVALFFLLPIRVGVWGRYDGGEDGRFRGWVRPWWGALGVGVTYREGKARVGLMVGPWEAFSFRLRKKERPAAEPEEEEEAAEEGEPEVSVPLRQRLEEAVSKAERIWFYARRAKPSVLVFLRRVLRSFRFRRFTADVVFGASDQALTGQMYGYVLAAGHVLGPGLRIHAIPDFGGERLEGEAALHITFHLYLLVWAALCLGFRLGWIWVLDRRRRRQEGRAVAGIGATN